MSSSLATSLLEFAVQGDITQDEFLAYFREAVSGEGEMPIFLLVLDELQQYIADSSDHIRVQEVINLSKGFNGSVYRSSPPVKVH